MLLNTMYHLTGLVQQEITYCFLEGEDLVGDNVVSQIKLVV